MTVEENVAAIEVDAAHVEELEHALRGTLIRPGDADYEGARRIWNGMIDRRPGFIVRCAGVSDVMAAVNFARDHRMLVAVRGGGHSIPGLSMCDGGMVIDLSGMKGIRVDPKAKTVRAEAGCLWSDLDHETASFGLATTGGQISHTGIAGLTLGGGFGWLGRRCGMVVDNLLSVDIVTADGRLLTASADENADLFWGLRGGGGNFGVATSFEYRLHEIGPIVVGGIALFPAARTREVLQAFRDVMASAPDELTLLAVSMSAPPAPFVPVEAHGAPMIGIAVCYAGAIDEGQRAVAPIRALQPVIDLIGPMPYTVVQTLSDEGLAHGLQYYLKAHYLAVLSDDAIDTFVRESEGRTSPLSIALLFPFGGAVARVPRGATAFGHRDVAYVFNIISAWTDPHESDRHLAWTRKMWTAMQPYATGGLYVNDVSDEGQEGVEAAYEHEAYSRLIGLKNTYDPTNLFRLNQNIKPTISG